jgi:lysozyme family protein
MKTLLYPLFLLTLAMSAPALTPEHDAEQIVRWNKATVLPQKVHEVSVIVDRIEKNWARYTTVSLKTCVPAHVIAALHNMEASGDFTCHLHEGSPLRQRTRFVPKGRPKTGLPPFSWEYSAVDAMEYDSMGSKQWDKLGAMLTAAELYNGSGYLRYHPTVPTPYLWAGTTVERPGKYIADGRWSSTARSGQVGVAALWKELERRKKITIPKP